MNRERTGTFGRRAGAGPIWVCGWLLLAPMTLRANPLPAQLLAGPQQGPVEASADQLDYDKQTGIIEGRGNVVIRQGSDELRADYVRYDTQTGAARATGAVTLKRADGVMTGESLDYNFKTGAGKAERLTLDAKPFRVVETKQVSRQADSRYLLEDATITTCTNAYPHCHYTVRVRELELAPNDYFEAHSAVWRFGAVPVMYFPYWFRDFGNHYGLKVTPGYDSKMGAFLLNSYRYDVAPDLRAVTHLDYRTRRGVALGESLIWNPTHAPGDLSLYYAGDQEPMSSDDPATKPEIDSQRYRIRLREQATLSPRDSVLVSASYLSDTDMLEDFFEDEYRQASEPDNHIVYTHRGDGYSAGLLLRKRLNDFYTTVERLPEASLAVMRQEIGDSTVFYDAQNSAGVLQKRWSEYEQPNTDYSAFRFDTLHMFYRPTRYWGFLNMVPRAGYRGTYYSESLRTVGAPTIFLQTNVVYSADGQSNTVVHTITNTVAADAGAVFRSRPELGIESSFKAFCTWEDAGCQYRHIVEPRINYTYAPRPNVRPSALYQFDTVDLLDGQNEILIGVRNKIQEKYGQSVDDLVDVDVYTVYRIERYDGGDALEHAYFRADLRPWDWLWIECDGIWSLSRSVLDTLNTRLTLKGGQTANLSFEHRLKEAESSLLNGNLELLPGRPWSCDVYARYELEDGRLEETGGYVQRNLDCLAIRWAPT
jgi:lipopolysaccharide assembly outer membrane protein LptD (OstA)